MKYFGGGGGGGGGAVSSVFGRIGAVVAALNDYATSLIDNDSTVAGATAKDALETLAAAISGLVTGVSSVFGRAGAVVAANGDYNTNQITDSSSLFLGASTLTQVIAALLGPVSTQSGAAYTLASGDGFVKRSHSSACTCTVPANATTAFPIGTVIVVQQSGAGALTIVAAGGVTINTPPSRNLQLTEQYSQVALKKTATNTWELIGDLGPILSATSPIQLIAGVISVLAVSNSNPGVAAQHAGAADVGKALLATSTAAIWSTNFGANQLTANGGFVSLSAAPVFQLGLTPTSGSGSASSVGDIRLRNNVSGTGPGCYGRNNADSGDVFLWGYDSSSIGLQLGASGGGLSLIDARATSIQIRGTTSVILGAANSGTTRIDNPILKFNDTNASPVIGQLVTAGATGQKLTVAAQQAATTGGALDIAPGQGGTTGGLGRLTNGAISAQKIGWNDTGVGLYSATPVAQAARVGQLTDSTTGTPATTLVDVGGVPTQANINNNFASVAAKMNALELLIHNLGASA